MKYRAFFIALGAGVVLAGVVGWSLLAFFIIRSGVLSSPGGAGEASGYTVKFGVIGIDSSRNPYLAKETATLPMKLKDTGFEYGVQIVPPDDKPFTYQMVFHFSSAPKVITGDGFASNAPSATMRTPLVCTSGATCDEYWFDEGDPMGDQSVDVYINGRLARTVRYTVVASDDSGSGN